ncbi:WD repeat-containing protein 19 [Eurytemora carolleeae]|uniref:WD repeat-containing protein 19 n=1 Tax=Eurytemora carolleeae TaxID=1294199 RepID=UPI000C75ECED|nr:WD repeat-containing protein 19 [Eurytemora carolleeae]|eukprot:XP_023331956.1 WD repeat-containing protein 19-like [Eurytemora affinis]
MSTKRVFSIQSPHGPGGVFFAWQRTSGGYLATTGYDQVINIYNRHADVVEKLRLPGMCSCFGWDKDGDLLAVITDKSANLLIWDANTARSQWLDTGIRDPLNVLIWSKTGPTLAIGSYRGNLMIYNHKTAKRVPVIGKHSKAITCGAWSSGNLLALGSEDRTLSISNLDGDTVRMATLRAEPADIQFCEMKQDERSNTENTVSLIVGGKTLYLFNMFDPENPIELAFQSRYGNIISYKWFGDGYILIGFSAGYFVVISTHMKEIGQELFQSKNHRESLTGISISTAIGKAASCGDNMIKIHELNDLKETSNVITLDDERGLDHMDWSEDGQLLAVSTSKGNLHVYLSKLPLLGSSCQTRVAYLTSLLEVTVTNAVENMGSIVVGADIEPAFLALGPFHLALGMNNRAWFYLLGEANVDLMRDREYLGTVQDIQLNADYCAVRYDGKIQLHVLESEGLVSEERESKIFPEAGRTDVISCMALTPDFLIWGTDMGGLNYFYIEDWAVITEFKHITGIKSISAEPSGTKIAFLDAKNQGYIYTPVTGAILLLREVPSSTKLILWDQSPLDKDVLVAYDGEALHTLILDLDNVSGSTTTSLGMTRVPLGQYPVLLYSGEMSLQTQSGKLVKLTLSSHDISGKITELKAGDLKDLLNKNLKLGRLNNSWAICQLLNDDQDWDVLARVALEKLEVDFATRVYRHIKNISMVWSLEELKGLEDKNLLSGHISLMLGDYAQAQNLFLQSSSPVEALHMRRDLLQWDQALTLADRLAPGETPLISREYGQQLEFTGDYPSSLAHYERGLLLKSKGGDEGEELEEHKAACRAGIARMALRCGDVRKGLTMCQEAKSRQLNRECAEILESMKQLGEAAQLYESSQYYDKAAHLYIKMKNWTKIGQILPNISSSKIQQQFARAKEADGKYKEAVVAYEAARDYDSAVRLLLDKLNDPENAVRIVKQTKSTEGAKMVAKFFQKLNDFSSAIQFLVLSRCVDEAFQLAQQNAKMDLFADIVGDGASPEDYHSIAVYFEGERNHLQSGRFYYRAGEHSKALRHLLKVAASTNDDSEALNLAIEVVGSSGQAHLARQLIEFLMGETDGVPKDAKYLFRLYMARKQYKEAAKTAVIIAREEQSAGNYRNAHDVLFNMYQELVKNRISVPWEMANNLMILHSYTLARLHVRRGDHLRGARMLLRVANNISKFPAHAVPILTSTVIECHRSGLKNSAFTYAAVLMRPEYRKDIDEKYRMSYFSNDVPESELYCSQCKNNLPYCIATGFHILQNDLSSCPLCKFPATRSELLKLVEDGVVCPMCVETIAVSDIKSIAPGQIVRGGSEREETQQQDEDNDDEEDMGRILSGSSSTTLSSRGSISTSIK